MTQKSEFNWVNDPTPGPFSDPNSPKTTAHLRRKSLSVVSFERQAEFAQLLKLLKAARLKPKELLETAVMRPGQDGPELASMDVRQQSGARPVGRRSTAGAG
jgi:hypothetical protein